MRNIFIRSVKLSNDGPLKEAVTSIDYQRYLQLKTVSYAHWDDSSYCLALTTRWERDDPVDEEWQYFRIRRCYFSYVF